MKKILSFKDTQVIAIDRDIESKKIADKISEKFSNRFIFKHKKFSQLDNLKLKNEKIRGILFDLGYSFTQIKDSKKAILHYSVLKQLDHYYLLEIQLETGRHHQIRSQLSHIGSPIKGDLKYGFPRSNKDASIHLHAHKIEFHHPVSKERLIIEAKPPNDPVWNACE